jgi:hypothetical protein
VIADVKHRPGSAISSIACFMCFNQEAYRYASGINLLSRAAAPLDRGEHAGSTDGIHKADPAETG